MEKEKVDIPLAEKLKGIPSFFGIHMNEMPKYHVLKLEGAIEIREYAQMVMARVTVKGPHEEAMEKAFLKLAGYIFGKNQPEHGLSEDGQGGQQMAMTSPVLQEMSQEAFTESLTMSFILPADIEAQNAPLPNDGEIRLEKVPVETWAVVRYSGINSLEDIEKHRRELFQWLRTQEYKSDLKTWRVAQYDSPNTIPALRRNEVQIKLFSDTLNS